MVNSMPQFRVCWASASGNMCGKLNMPLEPISNVIFLSPQHANYLCAKYHHIHTI